MKLTHLRSARSFYLLSFAFAIGLAGIASQADSVILRTESLSLFVRLLAGAMAIYACSKLVLDAKILVSKWKLERIRVYDVILCSLLFVNFVLAGVLFGAVIAAFSGPN